MAYDLRLLKAEIPEPSHGSMTLALDHQGTLAATLDLDWNQDHFTARVP